MKLFESGKIGRLSVKNRIVMAPMGIAALAEPDGTLSQRAIDYYAARAKGGTGLIITCAARVSREMERHLLRLRVDNTTDVSWLNKLADAVHGYGAKVALQLTAGVGRVGKPESFAETGMVAPSALPCFWDSSVTTRELTIGEIELYRDEAQRLGITVDEARKRVHEPTMLKIPLGRLANPEDIANVVMFLASSKSDYMTGQAINVTGGRQMS